MQELPGQRPNSRRYLYDGYLYHLDRGNYRCQARLVPALGGSTCAGRAILKLDGTVSIMEGHNHPRDDTALQKTRAREEMLQLSRQTLEPFRTIYNNVSLRYPNFRALKITYASISASMERERIDARPVQPQTFADLCQTLHEYQPISTIYRGCVTGTDGSIGIIFATDLMLERLNGTCEIFGDGPFDIVRNRCAVQLYTIHIHVLAVGFPVIYVIFERQTDALYIAIWQRILQLAPGLSTNLTSVVENYNRGTVSAIRQILPNATISGSHFHFMKAIFRKWLSLGLTAAPDEVLRMTFAMALVFSERFDEGLRELESAADAIADEYPRVLEFVRHVRRQWSPLESVISVFSVDQNDPTETMYRYVTGELAIIQLDVWSFLDRLNKFMRAQDNDCKRLVEGERIRRSRVLPAREDSARTARAELVSGQYVLFITLSWCTIRQFLHAAIPDNRFINLRQIFQCHEDKAIVNELPDLANLRRIDRPYAQHDPGLLRTRGRGRQRRGRVYGRPGTQIRNEPRGNHDELAGEITPHADVEAADDAPLALELPHGIRPASAAHDTEAPPIMDLLQRSSRASPAHRHEAPSNWRDEYEPDDPVFHIPEDDFEDWATTPEEVPFHPVAQQTENLEPQPDNRANCSLCKAAAATHAFVPCGHRCSCEACIVRLQEINARHCPICRAQWNLAIFVRDS